MAVHRSSIVHSLVECIDGSILCQMSRPDMKLAIQYSMTDPDRLPSPYGGLDFTKKFALSFEPPDLDKFPCLRLAYRALEMGGTAPAALNGANEEAVKLFVNKKISFTDIPKIISYAIENHKFIKKPDLEEILSTDEESKKFALNMLK